MTELFPDAQEILDAFKEKHPMLDDETARIFISTAFRAIVKTNLNSTGDKFINNEDILEIADELDGLGDT